MTTARRRAGESPRQVFRDRHEAGRVLAGLLGRYRGREDVIVLGLAPVSYTHLTLPTTPYV